MIWLYSTMDISLGDFNLADISNFLLPNYLVNNFLDLDVDNSILSLPSEFW